jgi:hypothetical protein
MMEPSAGAGEPVAAATVHGPAGRRGRLGKRPQWRRTRYGGAAGGPAAEDPPGRAAAWPEAPGEPPLPRAHDAPRLRAVREGPGSTRAGSHESSAEAWPGPQRPAHQGEGPATEPPRPPPWGLCCQ